MKKIIRYLFFIAVAVIGQLGVMQASESKTDVDQLLELAKKSLEEKEYTKARYLFKRTYEAFARQENYAKAIECGLNTCSLYMRENYISESLELTGNMERLIASAEDKYGKPFYNLRFAIVNERLRTYTRIKASERAKTELDKLAEITGWARNDSLEHVRLCAEANYNYPFGYIVPGDSCMQRLTGIYMAGGQYEKAGAVYRSLIEAARQNKDMHVASHLYERFILWSDSVKGLETAGKIHEQTGKYNESLDTIREKDDALSSRLQVISVLTVISIVLAVILVFLSVLLFRFIAANRISKKKLRIAGEHAANKAGFMQEAFGHMKPILDTISVSATEVEDKVPEQSAQLLAGVSTLQKFCEDIREFNSLESSLSEPFEMSEVNIRHLCEQVSEKAKPLISAEVSVSVNAPEIRVKTNPEQLERLLLYLLENAALRTEKGYIVLDVKKRGAHVFQVTISDNGMVIAEEQQESLFKPFSGVTDTGEGNNNLDMAICSLIAVKLQGSLMLDGTYKKGGRFILELRS